MDVTSEARSGTVAAPQTQARRASRPVIVCIILATLASLTPILSVRFPPMTDYANHYVRLWLLAGGIERPEVAAFYELDWNVTWTNLAIDLIAVALSGVASMAFIGPFVLALGLLMPPLGAILLNRRLFGGFHWWHLFTLTLAWNAIYLFGFLSYAISLGLALMLAALDPAIERAGQITAFAVRTLFAALLLVAHPFGLLFYAALLAGLHFGPSLVPFRDRRALAAMVGRVAGAMLPVFVPLVALFVFGPSLPGDSTASLFSGMQWNNPTPLRAIPILVSFFRTYDIRADILYIILAILLVRRSASEGSLEIHWGLVLAALGTALIAVVMPSQMLNTGGIENRLPCMMVLAAAAGLRPHLNGKPRSAVVAGIMLAVLLRIGFVEYVWVQRDADVAAVERVLRNVPAGAAVLPVESVIDETNVTEAPIGRMIARTYPSFWHYPALAIMERGAFMPYLFTAAGKQPLRVRPPWKEISVPEGDPTPVHLLGRPAEPQPGYMTDWNARFDYLLMVNADMANPGGPMPDIANVHLVADEGFARLYEIDHAARDSEK